MIEKRNVLRQIIDIQVQAERLIKEESDLTDIENFAKYSYELKSFLNENVGDDFILKYINEIPILDLDDLGETENGWVFTMLFFFGGLLGVYSLQQRKKAQALNIIRDIKGKYASAEFMLKNYFE